MAATPKVIKNFNLIVDGYGFAGLAEEVRLPDLKIRGEEHRASGMDAPAMIDLGMDRIELGFTMAEHNRHILRQFGLQDQNSVQLTFRAAQVDDKAVQPYLVNVRGMYTDQRGGTVRNGAMVKMEATISCRYYKLTLGGVVVHEFDVDNMIRSIDGVDQMEAIRAAIGL